MPKLCRRSSLLPNQQTTTGQTPPPLNPTHCYIIYSELSPNGPLFAVKLAQESIPALGASTAWLCDSIDGRWMAQLRE